MSRNTLVEDCSDHLLSLIDSYIEGKRLERPPSGDFRQFYTSLCAQGGSVRLASVFLCCYSLVDISWNKTSIPTGIRGKYGDKKLGASLNDRYITFHKSTTAFGENLGWKGNVKNVDLSKDPRFKDLVGILLNSSEVEIMDWVEWFAWSIAETQQFPKALPPLSANYMTYARSLNLAFALTEIPSEGHIQQFLIASLLSVHRKRGNIEVRTHHPHASDKFDGTAGDIEEFNGNTLVGAYEVTMRDDWKNRIPDLRAKMSSHGLRKYVLIGKGVSDDVSLYSPNNLLQAASSWGFDLAVVDIYDFIRVFCAELSSVECVEAFNMAHFLLSSPVLSGRQEFIDQYSKVVGSWMDQ